MTYRNVINLPTKAERFYKDVLKLLNRSKLDYLIGGSLALAHYMHLTRRPKDLDIFVRKEDCEAILQVLEENGYRTEILHGHWLAKAYQEDLFIDFIFSSGNGVAQVDDSWFDCATSARLLGLPVRLCSAEDIIWSKAFIMDRERFDGADITHLIRSAGNTLDWQQLVDRFGDHWRVLLAHLLLFQFIYPGEGAIPPEIMQTLAQRAAEPEPVREERICRGTLLSRDQYMYDIDLYGYTDARVEPNGRMTADEVDAYMAHVRQELERKAQKNDRAA